MTEVARSLLRCPNGSERRRGEAANGKSRHNLSDHEVIDSDEIR